MQLIGQAWVVSTPDPSSLFEGISKVVFFGSLQDILLSIVGLEARQLHPQPAREASQSSTPPKGEGSPRVGAKVSLQLQLWGPRPVPGGGIRTASQHFFPDIFRRI